MEKHSGLVRGVALRVVGADDVDDACQEVWVRAWRHAAGFRGDSAFRTWLYRVATNACLDLRRARLRRPEDAHGGDPAVGVAVASGGDSDPEASALLSERRREVRAALGRVRADHRAALVLRHAEGLFYAEIAASLGVPAGTAKGWASRGRSSLAAGLAAEGSGART